MFILKINKNFSKYRRKVNYGIEAEEMAISQQVKGMYTFLKDILGKQRQFKEVQVLF